MTWNLWEIDETSGINLRTWHKQDFEVAHKKSLSLTNFVK